MVYQLKLINTHSGKGRPQKRVRTRCCKRCDELFLSTGKFSSICPKCDRSGAWRTQTNQFRKKEKLNANNETNKRKNKQSKTRKKE